MRNLLGLLIALAAMLLSGCQPDNSKRVAFSQFAPKETLTVTSPDIIANQPIPDRFSAYGTNTIPALQWSKPPEGTQTLLLLVEDPDAPGDKPFIHYLVFNILPTTTSLTASVPPGAIVGNNSNGEAAYFGPRPPSGRHQYHFEVFALSTALSADTGASWETLLPKIQGFVLAGGELIAPYEKR